MLYCGEQLLPLLPVVSNGLRTYTKVSSNWPVNIQGKNNPMVIEEMLALKGRN